VDWSAFLTLVEHHGMAPHVGTVIERSREVPPDAGAALLAATRRAAAHSLLLTARLLQILDAFRRAGIPVIALKGPALSQQLYGDAGMRDSVDLDLLVPSSLAAAAASVLEARDYVLESDLGWMRVADLVRRGTELTFRHKTGTGIDLHWASAPADHPFRLPEGCLWSSADTVNLDGTAVPVLSRECQLVYLCVHGTFHAWTKLRWLCDVALLAETGRSYGLDWDEIDSIAGQARASRPLALGLRLAHDLLGAAAPEDLPGRLQDDETLRPFVADVRRRLESPAPAPQPTAVERTMFNARLATGGWQRARHVAALFKAPTAAEARLVRLPRSLHLLYYPLRAARLAAKYGRGLVTG
jgi:hypothetical protein